MRFRNASRDLRRVRSRCSWLPLLGFPADAPRFTRTEVAIDLPDVTLIDQYGREVDFRHELLGDKPVFVEFIFATCTTICPVLSAGFVSMQRKLGDDRRDVLLVSITIDPEHDGPEELRKYLDRYGGKSGWDFFTGTRTDIDLVMRAFDSFVADKMSHRPLTFVHGRAGINGSGSTASRAAGI